MSRANRPSYARLLGDVSIVFVAFVVVGVVMLRPQPKPPRPEVAQRQDVKPPEPVVKDSSVAIPPPPAPKPPPVAKPLDRDAIARAEADLDAAARDRALADDRAAKAAEALKVAEVEAAKIQSEVQSLSNRVRDPRARLASVQQRGELLQAEVKAIETERTALADAPRPKRKALIDKSPVARPSDGDEYHFELRRGHVSFIDMDKLIDKVKTDARIQIRIAGGGLRSRLASEVGPVGAFSMRYEMMRSSSDFMGGRGVNFDLSGWELIPVRENRGEPFSAIQRPASEFARAINRLSPRSASITLWIYPDSFQLYREIRDMLHQRGFTVAARPLPFGIGIRGSPGGSLSATQ
jgi:hypothetical protein